MQDMRKRSQLGCRPHITGTTATNAQTTIGKRNSATVSVDLSVLDQLGGTTNVPQLLRPSVRSLRAECAATNPLTILSGDATAVAAAIRRPAPLS